MLEYGNLSPLEFEYVCQDVMQAKLGTALRRFPAGRDDGIDLIDDLETNHIVVQVKHYWKSSFSALKQALKAERAKVVEKAQAEARAIIQEARDASDLAISELKELQKRRDLDWQQVNDSRAEARRLLNEAERGIGGPAQEVETPPPTRPAVAGDTVELVSMGTKATVLSVNKDGSLQLQAGILKISAKQDEVRVVEGESQSQKEARRIVARAEHTLRTAAVPSQVDLRGMMTDEAIAALERFLDTAMMGKLETVTIIHGKGTGAVRNAVRTYCRRSRYVKSFRPGRYGEGEDGVTVVELK